AEAARMTRTRATGTPLPYARSDTESVLRLSVHGSADSNVNGRKTARLHARACPAGTVRRRRPAQPLQSGTPSAVSLSTVPLLVFTHYGRVSRPPSGRAAAGA